MNYVLTSERRIEERAAVAEPDDRVLLYEELALALHAMAQPLTVLRGTLGALTMRETLSAEASRYLELSHAQVERLCGLMSRMQNLVDRVERKLMD